MAKRICSVPDCDAPHLAKGYCNRHYKAWKLYGDPLARKYPSAEERFWSKANQGDGCWPFDGTKRPDGYRQFGIGSLIDGTRRGVLAHRYAYELTHGPIPAELTVDHECHNRAVDCPGGPTCPHRACVRPDHLVAKSIRDNVLAGRTPPAVNLAKTHCHKGHPFDEANTRISRGGRQCRTCDREKAQLRRAADPERTREINRRAEARRRAKGPRQRRTS
jgi:hypothetical protein